jgi:hypothetical protein
MRFNAHNMHMLFWIAVVGAIAFIISYTLAGRMI